MAVSNAELERRVLQHGDVDAICDMLSVTSATQIHHGRNLSDVEARVAELDTRLSSRLDELDERLTGRLSGIDGRLTGMPGDLAEVLRRLPG